MVKKKKLLDHNISNPSSRRAENELGEWRKKYQGLESDEGAEVILSSTVTGARKTIWEARRGTEETRQLVTQDIRLKYLSGEEEKDERKFKQIETRSWE